jgi:predicted DNA-binding transcriptional regulator AlpA
LRQLACRRDFLRQVESELKMRESTDTNDTAGASLVTGLSVSTLEKLRVYGTGPAFYKLGRRVVYRRSDLESWMAACKRNSTSEAASGGEVV